jgi:hypothetical protein
MTGPAIAQIEARVAALLGARPIAWQPVAGGYTSAGRWRVRLASGATAFVKAGTSAQTAGWLRDEYRVYRQIRQDFLPHLLGWDDDGAAPLLILEDLGAAEWPPPWTPERVERVRAMLAQVAATPAPSDLPSLEDARAMLTGWVEVARDPVSFLALSLCSPAWLEVALPALLAAEAGATLAGEALVHLDVRSDNICFAGARAMLVDWNWACRGNPLVDVAGWLPSLRTEGGPDPLEILPDAPELAALMAGFFASRAGLPDPTPHGRLRALQLAQLRTALPWAIASLGLPPLDGEASR